MQTNCNIANGSLFYMDYKNVLVYTHKKNKGNIKIGTDPDLTADYKYDEDLSQLRFDAFRDKFVTTLMAAFPELKEVDEWKGKKRHIIMENDCVQIAFEDNNWSVAVEIILNLNDETEGTTEEQQQVFDAIETCVRDTLLLCVPTIYTRNGSWSTEPLTREIADKLDIEKIETAKALNG